MVYIILFGQNSAIYEGWWREHCLINKVAPVRNMEFCNNKLGYNLACNAWYAKPREHGFVFLGLAY